MKLANYSDTDSDSDTKSLTNEKSTRSMTVKDNQTRDDRKRNDEYDDDLIIKKRKIDDNDMKVIKPLRNIPHIEGNFASLIYIKPSNTTQISDLQDYLLEFFSKRKLTASRFNIEELHLSLSKTFYINYHHITAIFDELKTHFQFKKGFIFSLEFKNLRIFANETRNRFFISLVIDRGAISFLDLIKTTNIIMTKYNLETYYKDPIPHLSLCWSIDLLDKDQNILSDIINEMPESLLNQELFCKVDEILYKAGKLIHKISLL